MIAFSGYTHVIIGIVLSAMLQKYAHWTFIPLVFVVLGTLLPDIDHPDSTIGRFNTLAWTKVVQRRHFTHTLPGVLAFTVFLAFFNPSYAAGLLVGQLSHLLADTFNLTGIMWLYPYKYDYYRLARFPAGGMEETALFLTICMFLFAQ